MSRKAVWLAAVSLITAAPLAATAAEGDKASRQGQAASSQSASSKSHAQDTPVSDLIGKTAYSGDEQVGEIDELLMDRRGQVTAAVIDVGGFLGMGSKKVAVDFNKLKMDANNDRVTLSMNKQQLQQAPEFEQTAATQDRGSDRQRPQQSQAPSDSDNPSRARPRDDQ